MFPIQNFLFFHIQRRPKIKIFFRAKWSFICSHLLINKCETVGFQQKKCLDDLLNYLSTDEYLLNCDTYGMWICSPGSKRESNTFFLVFFWQNCFANFKFVENLINQQFQEEFLLSYFFKQHSYQSLSTKLLFLAILFFFYFFPRCFPDEPEELADELPLLCCFCNSCWACICCWACIRRANSWKLIRPSPSRSASAIIDLTWKKLMS